jgi:hypothetical protein
MIKFRWFNSGACPAATAGSATVTGYGPEMVGEILAFSVEYLDSPPATTDVVISDARDPANAAILTLANANTDGRWYPRSYLCDDVGTPWSLPVEIPIESRLKVVMTGANVGDSVNVGVWYRSE